MAETFRAKYGVTVLQLWGMTETNPLGVISTPSPLLMAEGEDFANDLLLTKQGRMQFGIELRIIDGDGQPPPWDGEQAGDRRSVVWGKGVSVRVDLGGRRFIEKQNTIRKHKI